MTYLRALWHIFVDNAIKVCEPAAENCASTKDTSTPRAISWCSYSRGAVGIEGHVLQKRLLRAASWAEPKAIITKENHLQSASPGPSSKNAVTSVPCGSHAARQHLPGHLPSSGLGRRRKIMSTLSTLVLKRSLLFTQHVPKVTRGRHQIHRAQS